MSNDLEKRLAEFCGCPLREADNRTIYAALLRLIEQEAGEKRNPAQGRKLYYVSAEFLLGRMLTNNLISLGLYEPVCRILKKAGKQIAEIEETEKEPQERISMK